MDARPATPIDEAPAKPIAPPSAEKTAALFALLESYLAQRASPEEQERLLATLRDGHTVPALLAHLEAAVEADPDDLEGRMQLANAYLAKLFTVPAGPEMGIWGRKAEAQWTAVLSRDDHHWEARFRLGTNYAYYPDMANKTGDAIHEFETLRRQQEAGPPEARTALHRRA